MNRGFRKWLACAVAVTIAVYNAPYSVEALEVIKDSVQVDSAVSPEGESAQSEDVTQEEEKAEDTTEQNDTDSLKQAGAFWVSGIEDTDWTFDDSKRVLTIKANTNDITIKGDGNTTTDRIVVKDGFTGNINLNEVHINIREGAPFLIENGASPIIKIMKGTNSSFITSSGTNAGIELNGENANITIDAEGTEGEWGSLTAKSSSPNAQGAGIGSSSNANCGDIEIRGGEVTATSGYLDQGMGAGIGSGSEAKCGNIIISGGKVTATSEDGGAGIGSGDVANCEGILIEGGMVTATSKGGGAGIGSGDVANCEGILIEGGMVTATSKGGGAGIGSGYEAKCGNIEISGGEVTATSSDDGAGIGSGSGYEANCGDIEISGGTVTATSSDDGAGIGSGSGYEANCGTITIKGGEVTATSSGEGAGIGSGYYNADCGDIIISGGEVTATSDVGGAGIGSGDESNCGTITIKGGTVEATSSQGAGAGIGSGYYNADCGDITISGGEVATSSSGGAGIGSGKNAKCGNIAIKVGTVTANSGSGAGIGSGFGANCGTITVEGGRVITESILGAGIGSGNAANCGTITISEGEVKANSGSGSGIGSGDNAKCVDITISGGEVEATSLYQGAGIGSGNSAEYKDITISGGTVTATGNGNEPGIGGGDSESAVIISGGSVKSIDNGGEVSMSPKPQDNKEKGEDVYLVRLDGQDDFQKGNIVTVVGKTVSGKTIDKKDYKVASNHPNDNSFYLYMPAGTYTITTHKGVYRVTVTANEVVIEKKTPAPTPEVNDMTVTNINNKIIVDVSKYLSEYGLVMCSLDGNTWVEENVVDEKRQVSLGQVEEKDSHTIYIKYKGNDEYLESESSSKEFKIGKITVKGSIVYTGNAITVEDIVEGNSSNGKVTLEYYQNGTELNTPPTDVGSYTLKATLAPNGEYTGAIVEQAFEITQATNSWKEDGELKIENSTYGKEFNEPTAEAKFGDVKFTYSKEENGTYTPDVPKNAGIYYVKAEVAGTNNYTSLESEPVEFEILKAIDKWTTDFNIVGSAYGGELEVTKGVAETGRAVKYYYSKDKKDWTEGLPPNNLNVGTYYAKAVVEENENYEELKSEITFTISQAGNSWIQELKIENSTYGKEFKKPTAEAKFGDVKFTYSNEENGTYTSNVPTNAGTYYVKAEVVGTENYEALTAKKEFKILKATSDTWVTELQVQDSIYGEKKSNILTEATLASGRTVKYLYSASVDGEYKEEVPKNVGTYYVKVVAEENDNYLGFESEAKSFTIGIAENSFTEALSIEGWTYGEEANTPTATAKFGDVEFTYSDNKEGNYTTDVPKNAGTYYVKATVEGTVNYKKLESVKQFTISKAITTLSFEKEDIGKTYDGEAISELKVNIIGNSNKDVTFTWYVKNGEDWTELNAAPTNAGEYKVVASIEADTNYKEASIEKEFKITSADSLIKFKDGTKLDKIYDGKTVAVTNEYIEKSGSTGDVTFTFEKKVDDKFEEITEAPKEAGTYRVKASLARDDNYNSASTTLDFIISRAGTILTFVKDNIDKTYDGNPIAIPDVNKTGSSNDVTFTWYVKNGEDWTELNAAPTNAGEYKVVASIEADTNYKEASIEKEFKITSADSSIKFKDGTKLDKIYDGKAVAVTNEYIEKTGSTGDVTFTFEKKVDDKFEEIIEAPKEVGTYRVKASLARDDNYNSASTTLDFIIYKADTKLSFEKENIGKTYDGEAISKPKVNIIGNSKTVTFTWYVKNGEDWTELDVAPTNAGEYKVVASIEADTNYKEASIEKEFTIAQAELPEGPEEGGKIEVTVPEWVEGNETQEPTVTIPEEKPEGEEFTVECYYKEYGADDNTYTEKVPTEAGRYTLKIEIKSANYIKTITKDFTIYAKAPEVTEESGKVDTSTDRIEINTEITEGDTDVYLYCTESTKVPEPPKISSTLRKVNKWEKVTGSNHIFTGLKPNTTYHVWKYDTSKSEGERLTYEYSIKTDTPSTPSIPSKPEEKPEEKPSIGVEVDVVDKIAGETRYDTSVSISHKVFPSKSEKVYLVSGEKFPDALSSAALAGKGDGPILLINDKNIDKILDEINRLDAKEIVFIGGNSISDVNEAKIRKFAKENSSVVKSIVGKDRYETAVKVVEQTIAKYGNKGKVIIADGRNYPDAVSIASYAAKEGIPVILVNGNKVPNVVKNFLNKYKINSAIIVGGDKAVGKNVEKLFKSVDRVAGVDRYDTSKKIAEKFFSGSKTVFVASGESFADSLSVSYYAGAKNAPILLTKSNSLDNDTREYLEKNKNKDYIIVGGDKAVNPELFK